MIFDIVNKIYNGRISKSGIYFPLSYFLPEGEESGATIFVVQQFP